MERDMDQVKKMTQHHQEPGTRRASSFKGRCLIPVKRKPQPGITTTLDEEPKSDRQEDVVHLKASLMGVKIYGDKDHFFSRQSSMSSNRFSSKFIPCCSGRPSVDQSKEISIVAASIKPPSHKRDSPGKLMASSPERSVSGVLYPSQQVGTNTHSSILNAVHFTFGDVTEKVYEHLLEQSKCGQDPIQSSPCKPERYSDAASTLFCESVKYPRVSCSTFSERLFGYEFSKDSPQRPKAKAAPSTDKDCDDSATDDDDIILEDDIIFEVPSGIALRGCGHDYAELVMVGPRPRASKGERWSSSKRSFNLELEKQPINVNRTAVTRDPPATEARAKLDVSHRDMSSSLNASFKRETVDQSSFRSDCSEWLEFEADLIHDSYFVLDSGRLKIDVQFDQADLLIPDLDNNFNNRYHCDDMDNKHHNLDKEHHLENSYPDRDGSAAVAVKMDEGDFPFNSPIASTFVFGDQNRAEDQTSSAVPRTVVLETDDDLDHNDQTLSSVHKTVILESNLDHEDQVLSRSCPGHFRMGFFETDDDLDHSDAYHDPDDCSVSDTDSSLTTFSLEADSEQQQQPSLWVSTRSFSYLREVMEHNSGFLDIESLSGRFSVDLRQQKRLGRVDEHHHHPGVRLVCVKRESKRSRSSLLAPCLVCVSCWHQRPQDP